MKGLFKLTRNLKPKIQACSSTLLRKRNPAHWPFEEEAPSFITAQAVPTRHEEISLFKLFYTMRMNESRQIKPDQETRGANSDGVFNSSSVVSKQGQCHLEMPCLLCFVFNCHKIRTLFVIFLKESIAYCVIMNTQK